ncbi:MAG: hypothetical protein K2M42_00650 [Oscillospiraceae bacterium]|nr:hypothetical protein [Oscillospiraceae bacterium]
MGTRVEIPIHKAITFDFGAASAKPGDFALNPDASHIGVVVGRNEAGKLLICHCASGQNNIVITEFSASGFTAVGKLAFMD